MRESEFRDFELRLRLNSDSAGVSRIDFEDGLVIYAALFTFAHGGAGSRSTTWAQPWGTQRYGSRRPLRTPARGPAS